MKKLSIVTIGVLLIVLEAVSFTPARAVEKDIQAQAQVHFQEEAALWAGPLLGEISEAPPSATLVPATDLPINQPAPNFLGIVLEEAVSTADLTPKVSGSADAKKIGHTLFNRNSNTNTKLPISRKIEADLMTGCLTKQCNVTATGNVNSNSTKKLTSADKSQASELTTPLLSEFLTKTPQMTMATLSEPELAPTVVTAKKVVLKSAVETKSMLASEVREVSVAKSVSEPSTLLALVATASFWISKRKGNKIS